MMIVMIEQTHTDLSNARPPRNLKKTMKMTILKRTSDQPRSLDYFLPGQLPVSHLTHPPAPQSTMAETFGVVADDEEEEEANDDDLPSLPAISRTVYR
jgi:hypothetical protein